MKMKHLAFILIIATTSIMTAQNQSTPSVDVTGEGVVTVVPDQVTINLRVENTGTDPNELKKTNDRIVNEVLGFIRGMGIDDKDVRTQYIRLSKNYEYQTKTYNYAANQSISVKLRDLRKYEALMNGLLESGINRIDGVSFSSSKRKELESEARTGAMANAKMKAEEYAGALGQSIGKAISITEFGPTVTPPPFARGVMAMDAKSGTEQTIAPGEMEIRVTINVKFELK